MKSLRARKALTLVAVCTFATVALSACASSGRSTDRAGTGGSGSSGGSTVRGLTDTTITLGSVDTMSIPGTPAPFANLDVGINARFARANREGGVNGRKIIWKGIKDDQANPQMFISGVKSLVLNDKVFAVGPFVGPTPISTSFLEQNHVPLFGWGTTAAWCGSAWALSYDGCLSGGKYGDSAFAGTVADALGKSKGVTYGAIMSDFNSSGLGVWKVAATQLGFTQCYAKAAFPTTPVSDYTPFVSQIMKSCPGGKAPEVFMLSFSDVQGEVGMIQSMRAAGYKGQFQTVAYDPSLLNTPAVAKALEGALVFTYGIGTEFTPSTGLTQMQADLKAIGKPTTDLSYGEILGYVEADFELHALKAAGRDLTAESLIKMMQTGYKWPGVPGLAGPVSYPENYKYSSPCASTLQVKNGKFAPAVPLTCYKVIPIPGS